tara:strand:+ start:3077 stop:4090 length:1014 start_codon:yes stop_codon:yes gene_type:complete
LGGLARKATIIDNVKLEGYNPIIVDAGNLFFKSNKPVVGLNSEINKINANVIVESFNLIGCDALSIGENDLSNGLDYILKLKENANFPFISANLVDKDNNLIFNPYVVVDRGDVRVAFIGLASSFSNSEVSVLDPLTSLKKIIDEVKQKSELIVLLFNADDDDVLELQNSSVSIDLIIRSKSKRRSSDGGKKQIPEYSGGDRGKYLYRLDLSLSESGMGVTDITSQNNIIKNAKKRLDRMKKGDKAINLKEFYKDDEKTLNRIKGYEKQLALAESKLENASNTIELTSYELSKEVVSRGDILIIVDDAKEKINLIRGPQPKDSKGRGPEHPHYNHSH